MDVSIYMKGYLFVVCIKSVILLGNETWAMKEEDVCRLEHQDKNGQMDMECTSGA